MKLNHGGGPKTKEGKKNSAKNSLKMGVYACDVVLPEEDPSDFELLHATFVRDLSPQDIVGQTLVRDIAGVAWKKMRVDRIETKVLIDEMNMPIKQEEYFGTAYLHKKEVRQLIPCIPRLTKEFVLGAISALAFANDFQEEELSPEFEQMIEEKYPVLADFLNQKIFQLMTVSSPLEVSNELCPIPMFGNESSTFDQRLHLVVQELKQIVWLYHHKDAILLEQQMIQHRRILAFMERLSGTRLHDDLRRSSAKLLAEYRKHEEWRRGRGAVDIEEMVKH